MTRDKLKGNFDYDYRNMPIQMYLNSGKVIHIAYDAGGQRTKFLRKSGSTTQDSSKIFMLGANGKVVAEYIYLSSTWKIDHYNIYGNELIGKVALIPATSGTVNKIGQTLNSSQTADSLYLSGSQIQSGGSVTLLAKNGIRVQSTFNSNGATVSLRPGVAAAGSGATGGFTDVRYYYLSDHLGSVRVTLTETGVVDSWSDYYPFGKEARGSSTVNEPKEQYNGKQRDYESGLDYYGMRYYNTEIARFITVDPLTRSFPELTPYQYASDNPISNIDIDGLEGLHYSLVRNSQPQIDPKIANSPTWTVLGGAAKTGTGLVGVLAGVSTVALSGKPGVAKLTPSGGAWVASQIQLSLVSMGSGVVDIVRGLQGKPPAELMNKVGGKFGLTKDQVDLIELIISGGQAAGALDNLVNGNMVQAMDAVFSMVELTGDAKKVFENTLQTFKEKLEEKEKDEKEKENHEKKKEDEKN